MQALHNSFNSIISQVRANPSAVNKRNISAANTYNYGYPELKREIMALSEDIEDGPYVRGVRGIPFERKLVSELELVEDKVVEGAQCSTLNSSFSYR
ncbi:hypothetical protein Q3G72_033699 [Acer saccharum]|nr:hypothetical protein Q3G72_033699 [Acer saccharum]